MIAIAEAMAAPAACCIAVSADITPSKEMPPANDPRIGRSHSTGNRRRAPGVEGATDGFWDMETPQRVQKTAVSLIIP